MASNGEREGTSIYHLSFQTFLYYLELTGTIQSCTVNRNYFLNRS